MMTQHIQLLLIALVAVALPCQSCCAQHELYFGETNYDKERDELHIVTQRMYLVEATTKTKNADSLAEEEEAVFSRLRKQSETTTLHQDNYSFRFASGRAATELEIKAYFEKRKPALLLGYHQEIPEALRSLFKTDTLVIKAKRDAVSSDENSGR